MKIQGGIQVGDMWKYEDVQTNGIALVAQIHNQRFDVIWLSANGFTVDEYTSTGYPILSVISGKSGWSKLT